MGAANPLDHLLRVGRQDVGLGLPLLLVLLLFLHSVIAHHWVRSSVEVGRWGRDDWLDFRDDSGRLSLSD